MSAEGDPARKSGLRKALLARRDGLAAAAREAKDAAILARLQALPELARAGGVFSFISHGHEPDTRRLLDWLLSRQIRVYAPRVRKRGIIEAAAFTGWEELAAGPLGILTPPANAGTAGEVDVCITPGVGFATDGRRLGHGAGYYDRWFATHGASVKIAPAYECMLCDDIPAQPHDVPVDIIVTEDRTIDRR